MLTVLLQAPTAGKKRAKEDWEDIWTYGFIGGMVLGGVLLFYKPDTRWVSGLAPSRNWILMPCFAFQHTDVGHVGGKEAIGRGGRSVEV